MSGPGHLGRPKMPIIRPRGSGSFWPLGMWFKLLGAPAAEEGRAGKGRHAASGDLQMMKCFPVISCAVMCCCCVSLRFKEAVLLRQPRAGAFPQDRAFQLHPVCPWPLYCSSRPASPCRAGRSRLLSARPSPDQHPDHCETWRHTTFLLGMDHASCVCEPQIFHSQMVCVARSTHLLCVAHPLPCWHSCDRQTPESPLCVTL